MKYIINENQYKLLKEYVQDGFSFDVLDSIEDLDEKDAYCRKYLGEPVGHGVARNVYDFDEETVLKLNFGSFHYNSNKTEWNNVAKLSKRFDIFPKYYKHADDFSWIICESVIPLQPYDCNIILGIPFSIDDDMNWDNWKENYKQYITQEICNNVSLIGFVYWAAERSWNKKFFINSIKQYFNDFTEKYIKKVENKYMLLMQGKHGEWFKKLYDYIINCKGYPDLHKGNFGIVRRNGKETIVIIDCGEAEY